MKTTLLTVSLMLALAAALPAAASDTSPPLPGDVTCTQKVKRTYRLAAVLRHGLPVKVSCSGPARVFVQPDFAAMSKAAIEASSLFPRGVPGIATVPHATLEEAGTMTLRPRLRRWGWSSPGDLAYTVVVR